MKKTIITLVPSAVVAFILGILCGYHGCESKYRVVKANANTITYKARIIKAQRAALNAADHVMDKNELFDTDGSDAMAKYLGLTHEVDSLYQLEK